MHRSYPPKKLEMAETILRLSLGAIREDFLPVHPSLSGPVRVWHSDRSSPSPIFDNRLPVSLHSRYLLRKEQWVHVVKASQLNGNCWKPHLWRYFQSETKLMPFSDPSGVYGNKLFWCCFASVVIVVIRSLTPTTAIPTDCFSMMLRFVSIVWGENIWQS